MRIFRHSRATAVVMTTEKATDSHTLLATTWRMPE